MHVHIDLDVPIAIAIATVKRVKMALFTQFCRTCCSKINCVQKLLLKISIT